MLSVVDLRRSGYKVRISHLRVAVEDVVVKVNIGEKGHRIIHLDKIGSNRDNKDLLNKILRPTHDIPLGHIYCRGGRTLVTVEKDGKSVSAEADCSILDNYNKRKGIKIALGRAFSEINA